MIIFRLKISRSSENLHLKLRPLTVLTGFNSGGKSTVMQALLLSDLACKFPTVPLNGPYGLTLGEAFDVLNFGASEPEIRFTLAMDSREEQLRLIVPNDRAVTLTAEVSSRTSGGEPFDLRIDTYLSAERLGPRDLLEVPPTDERIADIGEQGQFTAHVLAQRERLKVNPELLHPRDCSRYHVGRSGRGVALGYGATSKGSSHVATCDERGDD